MSIKYGDARLPSLRDKIREQELVRQEIDEKVEEKKEKVTKGRRLNK